MPTTNAQHQAARRARLRQAGKRQITVMVDNSTADLLRQLSQEHGKPQGEVVTLGMLLARQRLTAPSAQPEDCTRPVEPCRAASLAIAPAEVDRISDAPAGPPEGAAEAWWPANFRELLARD